MSVEKRKLNIINKSTALNASKKSAPPRNQMELWLSFQYLPKNAVQTNQSPSHRATLMKHTSIVNYFNMHPCKLFEYISSWTVSILWLLLFHYLDYKDIVIFLWHWCSILYFSLKIVYRTTIIYLKNIKTLFWGHKRSFTPKSQFREVKIGLQQSNLSTLRLSCFMVKLMKLN
jgi:hypothetical protein